MRAVECLNELVNMTEIASQSPVSVWVSVGVAVKRMIILILMPSMDVCDNPSGGLTDVPSYVT